MQAEALNRFFRTVLGMDANAETPVSPGAAGRRNMLLLIQLRWLAVIGQVATIVIVHWGLKISVPLGPLLLAPTALAVMNLVSAPVTLRRKIVTDPEILLALCVDVAALSWLLYFSGGATNPFAALYLMQVVLAAVLLRPVYAWGFVLATGACLAFLAVWRQPLDLPAGADARLGLIQQGALINFILIAVLLVAFVTRTSQNVRARDAYLAEARQQAAEQDHIVRMGLLASGAAHELGTPLASLSVILSDWRRMPALTGDDDLRHDIEQMQAEVDRCKSIVTNILMSAGEARGEAPTVTALSGFLGEIIDEWSASRPGDAMQVALSGPTPRDPSIIADPALKQVFSALLDNAQEAGARNLEVRAVADADGLFIAFEDDGPGFAPGILEKLGQPYQSTKARAGAGLGLFLLVNVVRKLGGTVIAANRPGATGGGAVVRLALPIDALAPK
ncbi:ATP-binding protein [Brevundimonas diminuta]|uniref:ATP-binding protein n=1 Tax=Brevundimonas diminuta TaxID=293 RepID=UPI0020986734|nr:ATP-binding protein [Brevundimonas diminuta]MCO8028546.1 ATP-binding protein [Brevundimonas diminuta]